MRLYDGPLGIGYFIYATKRWGIDEGLSRWLTYELGPRLRFKRTRRAYKRWKKRDQRERTSYGHHKVAINRDGDFYLVECPICHEQSVLWDKTRRIFKCGLWSEHQFTAYTEDGVVEIRDHREGNIVHFPRMAVFDPGAKVYRLGINRDAPWWWSRKEICRDLQDDGKDAHGHAGYVLVPVPDSQENLGQCVPGSPYSNCNLPVPGEQK